MATVATGGGYAPQPAAGAGRPRNPFGLPTSAGPLRNASRTASPMVEQNPVTTHVQTQNPSAPAPAVLPMPPPVNTAPKASALNPGAISSPGVQYNINADPALQMAYSFGNESNAQAQAQATSAEEQLIEQSGIGNLAAALGLNANVGTIAQNNQFSDAANLLSQENVANQAAQTSYGRNVQDLGTENTAAVQQLVNQLVDANEVFSGYGNYQKGLQAQQYQQALDRESQDLATALTGNTHAYEQGISDLTGQVQQQLGAIQQALSSTESQNAQAEIQAMEQAYQNAINDVGQSPPSVPQQGGYVPGVPFYGNSPSYKSFMSGLAASMGKQL